MQSNSRRVLMTASMGLAAAVLASSLVADAETEADAHRRLKLRQPRIDGEWAAKPAPTRKKGKPTKAEKKAAKRARTRGLTFADGEQQCAK